MGSFNTNIVLVLSSLISIWPASGNADFNADLHRMHNMARGRVKIEQFVLMHAQKRLKGRWKRQASAVAETILQESRRYRFDPLFLMAVIENESSFNPEARGTSGEIGLMQIMPNTARWVSSRIGARVTNNRSIAEVKQNIRLGAAYLDYLRARFPKNKDLYLAAYNMGAAKLARHLSRSEEQPKIYPARVMKRYRALYADASNSRN